MAAASVDPELTRLAAALQHAGGDGIEYWRPARFWKGMFCFGTGKGFGCGWAWSGVLWRRRVVVRRARALKLGGIMIFDFSSVGFLCFFLWWV